MAPESTVLDADYLVYGAGAMGIAFVDTLLQERKATVIIVDKHAQPGGHWNDAYPYVRLHQPSKFYGVNSRVLERSSDMMELASRSELLAYFEAVMESLVASGNVSYFPMCIAEDTSGHIFGSLVEPTKTYTVSSRAKVVDSTFMKVEVPSISDPHTAGRFDVEDGVDLVPLNDIAALRSPRERYVVIGAGKTGMDACTWLLQNFVSPERIHWVMPRDSWIIRRELFKLDGLGNQIDLAEYAQAFQAPTPDQVCLRLEKARYMDRLDKKVLPLQYKCATCSDAEISQLRRIQNIIRMGRVTCIGQTELQL